MAERRVLVLFGGMSDEHDVSVTSARQVAAHLDRARSEPLFVGITRAGEWRLCAGPDAGWESTGERAVLSPDRSARGLLVLDGAAARVEPVDVVFPVLHGRHGEDGAIQGLLELAGIPYVGCDIPGSAICLDKSLAYLAARSAGIATPEFRILNPGDPAPDDLEYPVFVKPARSGSSFGVRRVDARDELEEAIADARRFDGKVLVEQRIDGSEVGCAVLGDGDDLVTGELDEITLASGFFRIHQEAAPEQGSENAVITVPAELPAETRDRVRSTALAVYRALGCRGLARVDLFLRPDGSVVLNEVNTMPGFTSYSRYPRMMAAAGIGMTELIERCLELALAR